MSRPHLQWVCYPWELGTIYPGPWVGVEAIRMNRLVKFLSPYSTQETIFNNFLIIYHKLYLFMQLPCVIIRDIIFLPGFLLYLVCLNFNRKQTNKKSRQKYYFPNFTRTRLCLYNFIPF